ncbi:MAG: alpha/beta fold hydrolase [Candidatus Nanohaloarchaea archaeon]|nr:alpha/beta fold hydrolase [Candidatus Nanohaloarchaea archaeon]
MARERLLDVKGGGISTVFHSAGEDARGTVVFCHGLGSDKSGYRRRAKQAVDRGFDAVRFDFRGNGESSGNFEKMNLTTRIRDLQTVLDSVDSDNIGVYGSSFGGLVAIHEAVSDHDGGIDALALRSPVTFYDSLRPIEKGIRDRGFYEHLPGKRLYMEFILDVKRYSIEEAAEDLSIPVLLMHGSEDDLVPAEGSRRFHDRLECRKRLEIFEGEGHRFGASADRRAVDISLDWFEEAL